jgi:1,4-alpha-glucan branching enzyme
VPSHFAVDGHGLAEFDGTHLFEHADPRQGFHPDWGTFIFNYSRNEVRSFLLSSAFFWLDKFHVDGLRVDAVASMLYLDYSREDGEWIANEFGGNENLDAIWFLRRLNEEVYGNFPGVQMVAEESTAWPMVSGPTYIGGLGFGFKWDMGWMHDTLSYLSQEPVHRSHHHNEITFRSVYAFTENYVLPLSHDEVVHEKGSLLSKMPGDSWQQFANLRLLYSYQFALPGKKLLFMGAEIGQRSEWNHDGSIPWDLLDHESHRGVMSLVSDLGGLYREEPALHQLDTTERGYQWLEGGDWERSILAFFRMDENGNPIVCIFNFTPVPRTEYRVGVPSGGDWVEILNSDHTRYWGSGHHINGSVTADDLPWHGQDHSVAFNLPPLAAVYLKPSG